MKSVWYFLKWHWSKWTWGQRAYILGAGFFGSGLAEWFTTGTAPWQINVAFTIWGVIFAKWFLWDSTIQSWKQFKKEQRDMLETIKQGERQ